VRAQVACRVSSSDSWRGSRVARARGWARSCVLLTGYLGLHWATGTEKSSRDLRRQQQDPDPDPLVRADMDRIRIHTNMSWIRRAGVGCRRGLGRRGEQHPTQSTLSAEEIHGQKLCKLHTENREFASLNNRRLSVKNFPS
jgi:hypothetical protein